MGRDARRRRAAALPLATALRDALAPAAAIVPAAGAWCMDMTLHRRQVGLRVLDANVRVSVRLTPERCDLTPAREFMVPGGMYNDPKDPYRPLDPAVLGEGWAIRGVDAERHVRALAPVLRPLLVAEAPPWIVDGELRTFVTGDDPAALAAEIRELARRLS